MTTEFNLDCVVIHYQTQTHVSGNIETLLTFIKGKKFLRNIQAIVLMPNVLTFVACLAQLSCHMSL